MVTVINDWLDRLPRARFGARSREVPAFRTIGVAGFYLAVLVTMGSGLATGRSPVVLAVVSVACGLSFFVWALVRRAVVGRESFVLLEHVWFALAWAAAVVAALGEPVLAYLDVVSLGLCAFLGVGRIGCLVVGCCHGQPSIVGIRYGPELVDDGLPTWLVGVRLFPVQLVEAVGIGAIGVVGLVLLGFASAGTVFVWFLVAYAVLRFGLEGLRGDDRGVVAGMSVPRWMALAQGAVALGVADPVRFAGPAGAALGATVVFVLLFAAVWRRRAPERVLSDPDQLQEIRDFIAEAGGGAKPSHDGIATRLFPGGLSVAVSPSTTSAADLHVSFALPMGRGDLRRLCAIAAATVDDPLAGGATMGGRGTLHVLGRLAVGRDRSVTLQRRRGDELYGDAVRSVQRGQDSAPSQGPVGPAVNGRRGYFDSVADGSDTDVRANSSSGSKGQPGFAVIDP